MDEFIKAKKIAAYFPIDSELDCLPLVQELRKRGGEILLPFIIEDNKNMVFRLWQENEQLKNGLYGIKTPNDNAPILAPDLIILPLLAFDKKGARVGYGKGFYDRAIAELKFNPVLVGYAYSVQEIDYIESESHDIGLDFIVSEKEVRRF